MPDQQVSLSMVHQLLAQLVDATRDAAAATMAAAVIAASGKPTSIEKILDIRKDIRLATGTPQKNGIYEAWAKTKEERLGKIHD